MPDRRQDAATAVTGAGLVAAGGAARHEGIERAVTASGKPHPRVHPTAFGRNRAGRALYLGGTAAGLIGATGLGVGVHGLTRRRPQLGEETAKAESFLRQGLEGNRDALQQRVDNTRQPKPAKAVVVSAGLGAGAGWAGSQLTGRALRLKGKSRAAAGALGGTVAGLATLPLTSRATSHVAPGYEVTPTGVKRKKKPNKRPTSQATITRSGTPGFRQSVVPTDLQKSVSADHKRREAVQAASSTPVVGPVAGPAMAAQTAQPGSKINAAANFAGGQAIGVAAGGVAGAYGAAGYAANHPKFAEGAQTAQQGLNTARTKVGEKIGGKLGSKIIPKDGPGRFARAAEKIPGSARALKPLKAVPAAAAVGALAGSKLGGLAGGQVGLSAAMRTEKQRSENLSKGRRVSMSKTLEQPLTRREQVEQYKRKRRGFAIGAAGTAVGAAGTAAYVGSLAAKHPLKPKLERAAIGTAVGGGTIGAASGINNFGVQRRNLRQEKATLQRSRAMPVDASKAFGDPTKRVLTAIGGGDKLRARQVAIRRPSPTRSAGVKRYVQTPTPHPQHTYMRQMNRAEVMHEPFATARTRMIDPHEVYGEYGKGAGFRSSSIGLRRTGVPGVVKPYRTKNAVVTKVQTSMKEHEAKPYVSQYGLKGPLPKTMDRDTRMKAYEARYVAAGGPKGEKHQRRSQQYDKLTGGAVAVGGASAFTEYATGKPRIARQLGGRAALLHGRSKNGALLAGGTAAASELMHRHHQNRAASYRSSPAGVAASALRRMQDYTP